MTNVTPLPPRTTTVNRKADRLNIRLVGCRGEYTLLMGKVELAAITKQGRYWVSSGRQRCVYPRLGDVITATVHQLEIGRLLQERAA